MAVPEQQFVTLNNGVKMPAIGALYSVKLRVTN